MNAPLLAVLDETGTTNRPQVSTESDFGVGVVIVGSSQTALLADAARRISELVKVSDFKYKHVQRNSSARQIFLDSINKLQSPSGVFGFYSPGRSLLNEKDRAVAEMAFLGSDDGGETSEIAELIRGGDNDTHLESFLGYFVSCMVTYTASRKTRLNVHWDRRTDLTQIHDFCDQQRQLFRSHPVYGDVSECVSFGNDATGDLSSIARLAGIVAGDVRCFFQRHGNRVWSHLADAKRVSSQTARRIACDSNEFVEEMTVATISERLADVQFSEASRDTCMIQGYSKRFISNLIAFAAPNGVMGQIRIHHGSKWDILQIPD